MITLYNGGSWGSSATWGYTVITPYIAGFATATGTPPANFSSTSLTTTLISNSPSNAYAGQAVWLLTINATNPSVETFGRNSVSLSCYVSFSSSQPSFANPYGIVVGAAGGINVVRNEYGLDFTVTNSAFYLTYNVYFLRLQ